MGFLLHKSHKTKPGSEHLILTRIKLFTFDFERFCYLF